MIGNALAAIGRWGSMLGDPATGTGPSLNTDPLFVAIWNITWPILTVIAALGGLFAIWLGVRLAMAQDESKRKEAKAQLIYAIIAVVVIAAIITIMGIVRTQVVPQEW